MNSLNGFGNVGLNNVTAFRNTPPAVVKQQTVETPTPNLDNQVSINFSAASAPEVAQAPAPQTLPESTPLQTPLDQKATPAYLNPLNSPGVSSQGSVSQWTDNSMSCLMMQEPTATPQQSSSLDGFLKNLAGGAEPEPKQSAFGRGLESSGMVLKRGLVDAANFGNKIGKMLGCDETAPGLKGFVGTNISMTAAMIGGLAAAPLALVAGLADAISSPK